MTNITELVSRFNSWLDKAKSHPDIIEPTAFCLATSTLKGYPSARIVLLKQVDESGYVFFTNNHSRKGSELAENHHVSLCFYWMPLGLQVRVEGEVALVTNEEADSYFAMRSRESQLGAWASHQSEELSSRDELMSRFADVERKYEGKEVPRPPHWSGWRVVPRHIEFWEMGDHRLHHRECFELQENGSWSKSLLNP